MEPLQTMPIQEAIDKGWVDESEFWVPQSDATHFEYSSDIGLRCADHPEKPMSFDFNSLGSGGLYECSDNNCPNSASLLKGRGGNFASLNEQP